MCFFFFCRAWGFAMHGGFFRMCVLLFSHVCSLACACVCMSLYTQAYQYTCMYLCPLVHCICGLCLLGGNVDTGCVGPLVPSDQGWDEHCRSVAADRWGECYRQEGGTVDLRWCHLVLGLEFDGDFEGERWWWGEESSFQLDCAHSSCPWSYRVDPPLPARGVIPCVLQIRPDGIIHYIFRVPVVKQDEMTSAVEVLVARTKENVYQVHHMQFVELGGVTFKSTLLEQREVCLCSCVDGMAGATWACGVFLLALSLHGCVTVPVLGGGGVVNSPTVGEEGVDDRRARGGVPT
mgnify:CR=1 FL=1